MLLNEEQLAQAENLSVAYQAWIDNEQAWLTHQDRLNWKTINGAEYLYRLRDREGNGESLGRRNDKLTQLELEYSAKRNQIRTARKTLKSRLDEVSRICRALRMPGIDTEAARVLIEADRQQLLGNAFIVVGTNALLAYEYHARRRFPRELSATRDFDIAWTGSETLALTEQARKTPLQQPIMSMLKAVDRTYTVNAERPFQARNARAFEVELLAAPSVRSSIPQRESLRPVDNLPEQEWLLKGRRVEEVVIARQGMAARIVAPDPRWYALHKSWLSEKPQRNLRKVKKDQQQGKFLLELLREGAMPLHPLNDEFLEQVPKELKPYLG